LDLPDEKVEIPVGRPPSGDEEGGGGGGGDREIVSVRAMLGVWRGIG
jgi:hypothetical protein